MKTPHWRTRKPPGLVWSLWPYFVVLGGAATLMILLGRLA